MSKVNVSTVLNKPLHGILLEVVKSIKRINSKYRNDFFVVKSTYYSLRNDFRLEKSKSKQPVRVYEEYLTSIPSCGITTWHWS